MNIEHLEYILAVSQCKSITKASKQLFISQPRLSYVIKSVEDEVGYSIFQRQSTGVSITEKGKVFIEAAHNMYQSYISVKDPFVDFRKESDSLSITSCSCSLFSYIYFEFKKQNPTVEFVLDRFREGPFFPLNIQSIENRDFRMAITNLSHDKLDYYNKILKHHDIILHHLEGLLPVMAVVPVGHPLSKNESIRWEDLWNYPVVTYEDWDYDYFLGEFGAPSDLEVQYVTCRATFYDALRSGYYVSIATLLSPGENERINCVRIPIVDSHKLIAAYMVPSNIVLNKREHAFLEFFSKSIAGISKKYYASAKE